MQDMLSIYRDRLINLSSSNRTLVLKKLYKKRAFDLSLLGELSEDDFYEKLIFGLASRSRNKIKLLSLDCENYSVEEVEKLIRLRYQLNLLNKETIYIQKEKGSYDLYIGYPFVEGNFKDGTFVKAPLLLFPVKLIIENDEVFIENTIDESIMINKTFVKGFQKYNDIKLPDFEVEFEYIDHENIIQWVKNYLGKYGIKINTKNLSKEVSKFEEYTNRNVPLYELGELELKNNLIIGNFPISTSAIYEDYTELMGVANQNKLVSNLIETGDYVSDVAKDGYKEVSKVDFKENDLFFVTELDYSQEKAIISTNKRKEVVIYGPPGTGKSQVIVNLIIDNLAKGKKVLMVSQKKAAIDVVYNRLSKLGLKDRIGVVVSSNIDRQSIFYKIQSILEQQEYYHNNDLDKEFETISNEIDKEILKLEKLAKLLHEKTSFGLTLHQLYSKSFNDYEYYIELISDNFGRFINITNYELENMIANIKRISKYLKYDFNSCILKNRQDFSNFQEIERDRVVKVLSRVRESIEKYVEKAQEDNEIKEIENLLLDKGFDFIKNIKRLSEDIDELKNYNKLLDIKEFSSLNTLARLSRNIKKRKFWKLQYWKSRRSLKSILNEHKIKDSLQYIDQTIKFNSMLSKIKSFYGIESLDYKLGVDRIISKLEGYVKNTKFIENLFNEINILERYFDRNFLSDLEKHIFENNNWQYILEDVENIIKTDFENIQTLDYMKKNLTDNEKILIRYCIDKYGENEKEMEKLPDAIRNTIYLKHIELAELRKRDILGQIDNMQSIRDKVNHLMKKKRELVPSLIIDKLNKDIENSKSYNRLGNETNFREIKYEVGKKRNRMTLRRFVHSFYEKGLFSILPCWLVTPEAVSSSFPLKENLFDTVIFDEASQMFVENGIPAIYRANSVIIAGDDKQLQPSDIYQARIDDIEIEEEYFDGYISNAPIEAKSLLDLAKFKYDGVTLNYHYRSLNEELINFSNYAFYNGKMEIVPNISNNSESPPIERIKIQGRWIDRKNFKEAKEVVNLVKNILFNREYEETIGIITFNSNQKDLIEDLLDREATKDMEFGCLYRQEIDRKDGDEDKSIFVKNIENVQGDERDIIIFSIGYAPNEEDRIVRNFGSLTMKSGENRLNVAISRAKKKIYVITSIEPEELGNVDNLSRGVVLLKKYLQYVRAVSNNDKDGANKILYSLLSTCDINNNINHFDSPFEEEVYEALVSQGYSVHTQVGSSGYKIDLAIYDEEKSQYILGIECDGATYHSSKSARERDIYRQKFLENRGWTIHRIWSRNWWKNKEKEIDKIKSRVQIIENTSF
ncbi:putative superfamily I DNA helicase [Gottschalkia purinilytica]|uniref:Putative superfamily I DNA helicase n=2 Tax=Gottschalkia purinilytica TaxID=1503 RepID=A0A0L0W8I5_GOTPU|nr:putative superfamily I DNA helicase [Gottschalkia purinilytica]